MSFISVLKKIGQDFEKGLTYLLPIAEGAGEAAVSIFAPTLSPIFNTTVNAIALAEQKYVALKQESAGPQKLIDVTNLIGPLIQIALKDAGKPNAAADVQNYVNSVVTILNLLPASAITALFPSSLPVGTQTVLPPTTPVPAAPGA